MSTEEQLARPHGGFSALVRRPHAPDGLALAVLAIAAVALLLRVVELGSRAMHHDESLHATYAWYLAEGRGYEHNPLMHGPLLFHAVAGLFKLAGDGEVTSRLPMAIAGAALVTTPLLFRRSIGPVATVAAATLLTLSPVLLYFSRFSRNDVIAVLWAVLIVAAVWRYRADGRTRWLVLAAAALALGFATKETAYIVLASTLLYLNATLTGALLDQADARGPRRAALAMALFPVAWVVAALWTHLDPLRARLGFGERPREADLLVVLGTLTLPFLAAGYQFVTGDAETSRLGAGHGVTVTVLATMGAAALVGMAWDARRWPLLALVVLAITVPLYTTWFTNPDGFLGAFWGQLDYWLDQQDVRRGNQPWFYYLMMLPLYEFLVLIPALLGGAWLLRRGDRLARLLAWWFVSTLLVLTFAGEKMPWLNVHLAVPLALLAGHAIGAALPPLWRRLRDERATVATWGAAGAGAAAVLLLVVLSLRTAVGVSFGHPDTPVEPLIYTQTAPDVPRLTREIEDHVAARPDPVTIVVDTTSSLTWPWAWYLRDLPDVRYLPAESVRAGGYAEDAIVITSSTTLPYDAELRQRFAFSRPYVHRWWFPEAGYRTTSWGRLLDGLASGELIADWADFIAGGVPEDTIGALRGEVLFPP